MAGADTPADKSDRAFRTISEAAETVGVPQHVLRFWETRFSQLQPLKRGGNRRYYRPADMALLETIRAMLHDQGLTIRGAQLALAGGKGAAAPAARTRPKDLPGSANVTELPPATQNAAQTGAPPAIADLAPLIAIRDRLRAALAA